ncbi:conserved protein of unknown function [Pararobbsia alpina]|uniref:hypothetical protein n=1 Tax=Pararobbsia alpina TaxID=621374 RepID=UPI0039A67268
MSLLNVLTPTILAAVISSSVVSTLLAALLGWFKEWRLRNGLARDTALSVAVELERYCRNCVHKLLDLEYAIGEAERQNSYQLLGDSPIPGFVYQVDVTSRELEMSFLAKLREFPNAIEGWRRDIFDDPEHYDPLVVAGRKVYAMAHLARRSWVLAIEIRKHYRLDAPEIHERNWNMHEQIQRVLVQEIRAKQRRLESDRKMIEQLNALVHN